MCAIIDANVVHEVFGSNRQSAGKKFFDWIDTGRGELVIGGKLTDELYDCEEFRLWAMEAERKGDLRVKRKEIVMKESKRISTYSNLRSDDPHIIALAVVSGARLLYSNDQDLHRDFKDKKLIDDPRGSIFSTNKNKNFTTRQKQLLERDDLCRPNS